MKANGITCTDYAVQGEQLVLCLTGTTMEDALAMERSVVRITTDDGVQVEALPGYENAVSVTYLADTGVYQLTLTRAAQQGVGAALDALAADNTALRGELAEITTEAVRTRAAAMAFAAGATTITDGQALTMPGLFPTWEEVLDAGQPLKKGQVIDNGGTLYRVEQESVTPQAHQPPGDAGQRDRLQRAQGVIESRKITHPATPALASLAARSCTVQGDAHSRYPVQICR